MIGSKRKTPKLPTGRPKKKSANLGWRRSSIFINRSGSHNDRHGKMGARERAAIEKLKQEQKGGA